MLRDLILKLPRYTKMSNQPRFNDPDLEDSYCFTPNIYSGQFLQGNIAAPAHDQVQNPEEASREEGSDSPTTAQVKMSERHRRVKQLLVEKVTATEGNAGEGSCSKKLDHNARERIRRMRLNASYLALRALLPDSRRSKKRWTAPAIVDRVLKYIPELENEIENLRRKKDNAKNKQEQQQQFPNQEQGSLTVSINEVQNGGAIVQICKAHENEDFSRFLDNMEAEGVCIKTASALSICDNRNCYQLHIQWDVRLLAADYIRKLRDKVICWLR